MADKPVRIAISGGFKEDRNEGRVAKVKELGRLVAAIGHYIGRPDLEIDILCGGNQGLVGHMVQAAAEIKNPNLSITCFEEANYRSENIPDGFKVQVVDGLVEQMEALAKCDLLLALPGFLGSCLETSYIMKQNELHFRKTGELMVPVFFFSPARDHESCCDQFLEMAMNGLDAACLGFYRKFGCPQLMADNIGKCILDRELWFSKEPSCRRDGACVFPGATSQPSRPAGQRQGPQVPRSP